MPPAVFHTAQERRQRKDGNNMNQNERKAVPLDDRQLASVAGGRELTDAEYNMAMGYVETANAMYEKGEIGDATLTCVGTQLYAYERYITGLADGTNEELFDLEINWVDKRLNQKNGT